MDVIEASVAMYVIENERASKNGKSFAPKYLIFRHNADSEEDNIAVRAYGRSSTVKTWLGANAWECLGFDIIQDYPGQWLELDTPLYIAYEEKLNDDNEFIYYAAMSIDTNNEVGKNWERASLDNEIATICTIKRDGKSWEAEGHIDDQIMRVTIWPEHRRAIDKAGYEVTWDKPEVVLSEDVIVSLQEHNGRRRVDEVLIVGTEDDWIKSKQQE